MHSSSALCVFGVARLISSASTTWAKIGPGRNSNSVVFWLKIERPVTSDGSRSGVNWMRRKMQPMLWLSALASIVLPTPGHVLDQDVALAEQRHERHPHLDVLADDHALDAGDHPLGGLLDVLHGLLLSPIRAGGTAGRGPICRKTIPQRVTKRRRFSSPWPDRRSHSAITRPPIGAARPEPEPPHSTRTAIAIWSASHRPAAGAKPMNQECGACSPPSWAVPVLPAERALLMP